MTRWKVTVHRRQVGTVEVEAEDATDAGMFFDPGAVEWQTVDTEVTDIESLEAGEIPDSPGEAP